MPFPHLEFIQIVTGSHTPTSFPRKSQRSVDNLGDLRGHGRTLSQQLQNVQARWRDFLLKQAESGFELSTDAQEAVPLFLQVDPKTFKADTLRGWGIDVVAEEANGFIIGVSSSSNFPKLNERLDKMMAGTINGVQNVAELWEIQPRGQSLQLVVAPSLLERWETIDNEGECWIEITISVDRTNPGPQPSYTTEAELNKWRADWAKWDNEKDRRTDRLEQIVETYSGELHSIYDQNDTTNYKISISGKGVKDIALNFPYALEISEWNWQTEEREREDVYYHEYDTDVLAPIVTAAKVCIIDSGIQTSHRLLSAAVDDENSRCYVPGETSIADHVSGGGHGTRVASAVLYPHTIPSTGSVQPIAWIQNARVLNARNSMDRRLFPPRLMRQVIEDYRGTGTRLYNLSIQSPGPCRTIHVVLPKSWTV